MRFLTNFGLAPASNGSNCGGPVNAIAPRFKGDALNGYFVYDREGLVEDIGAQIWISGHVHDPYRAVVGNTLVIGNPAGYPREAPESGLYRPDFAIDVEPLVLAEWQD